MPHFSSNIIALKGAAESRQGGRAENQDDWGAADTRWGFLVVVCDGMGGGPGGKTASGIAKTEIIRGMRGAAESLTAADALRQAVAAADAALKLRMKEDYRLRGMGSTFVALLLNKHSALVAHAGDSRLYRLHKGRMAFRTDDHSLVGELVRKGALTEEQARTSPQSNLITRGLGSVSNTVPEIDEVPYARGDRFVLCTDGVWGMMEQKKLLKEYAALKDLSKDVALFSQKIDDMGFAAGGGHDNHTLVVIDVEQCSALKEAFWKNRSNRFVAAGASLTSAVVALGIGFFLLNLPDAKEPIEPVVCSLPELAKSGAVDSDVIDSIVDTTMKVDMSNIKPSDHEESKRLQDVAQKVDKLLRLNSKDESEAQQMSEAWVEDLCSELKGLYDICDSLNTKCSLDKTRVKLLSDELERDKQRAKRIMLKDSTYVLSYDAQKVINKIKEEIEELKIDKN